MSTLRDNTNDAALLTAWQELTEEAALQAAKNKPWLLKLLANQGAALAARYALWKERLQRLQQGERRRLQRRLGVRLAGAALLLALNGGPAAHAGAPIVVDGFTCTLVDAIAAANTDSVVGGCTTGYAGADAINLQTNVTLTEANNSTPYDRTGLPVITSEITIEGNGHTISRDVSASTAFRILAVGSGGDLSLNNVTISEGVAAMLTFGRDGGGIFAQSAALSISNSTISGNWAFDGGGIYAHSAMVMVSNSTIIDNQASYPLSHGCGGGIGIANSTLIVSNSTLNDNNAGVCGGGIDAHYASVMISDSTLAGNETHDLWFGGWGGGINAVSSTLGILNSQLSNNMSDFAGAILSSRSTLMLSGSSLSGNAAWSYSGGGIHIYGSALTVSTSTISNNSARTIGGGIKGYATSMVISASTLSGNTANSGGGGIYAESGSVMIANSTLSDNSAGNAGGGIFAFASSLSVSNSTLSGNSALSAGGGVYARSVSVLISNSTLSGNSARFDGGISANYYSTMTLQRSLISGNIAAENANEVGQNRYGFESIIQGGNFNLFGHHAETGAQAFSGFTPSGSDIVGTSDGGTPATLGAILNTTLADNDSTVLAGAPPGSAVQTLALPPGSPAIDKAPSAACVALFDLDQRGKPRNADGDGAASSNECDIGAFELQTTPVARISVRKQTLPPGDPTEFLLKLRGPVGRDFALADNEPHSTGQIPAGIYTLQEVLPPGWDPAVPFASMTCDDGSPLSAIDLAADEVLVCRFLNYKRGNIVVKKVTLPPVAAPSFAMRLINNTTNAKTLFSLANAQQFDTGAITSVPTYKLLETLPGGWKKKNIVCSNGSASTAIAVPPGGTVTCTVTNENSAPSNISISNSSVAENKAIGTLVGDLSATDAVAGDTHSFSFVNDGTPAAANNGNFQIVGAQLKTAKKFDFETKSSHNIKLMVTDPAGQTKVKAFVISIIDGPN